MGAGDLGEDDDTVIERDPDENVTPVELPRCFGCGRVVFFDDFTQAASAIAAALFSADRWVRARDDHWWWCGELWELRYKPPR